VAVLGSPDPIWSHARRIFERKLETTCGNWRTEAEGVRSIPACAVQSSQQRSPQLARTFCILIKGFVLPYLGQQDERLPWKPPALVPRTAVINYPTDFGQMSDEWITTLSNRGEQLTRGLVPYYLSELVG
jgi:NTE family protein